MIVTDVNKNLQVTRTSYLPWTTADNSLFCITLKIGIWKSHFTETEYKIMIAEALNDWVHTQELRMKGIKITGYLISSTKLCLVLYQRKDFEASMLNLFYKELEKKIWGHHLYSTFKHESSETGSVKNKKFFEALPFTSEYIVLLITGRQVRLPYYNPHLARLENYIQNNNFCSSLDYSGAKGPVEVCLLQKYDSPFMYPVGINYQCPPRHSKKISAELDFLSRYFSLIKTFDCAKEKTEEIKINESMQEVIDFITRYRQRTLQLIMGTNNNALARKEEHEKLHHEHERWKPGLMTHGGYTDKWVHMIIKAFGDKATALKHLTCICLGDEIDAYGPKEPHKKFKDYYEHWIPEAFSNLKVSLARHGLENIPVTTTIKNYSLDHHESDMSLPEFEPATSLSHHESNKVAYTVTKFINQHWSAAWNNNKPFIFFDHYTHDDGRSTGFAAVQQYYNEAQDHLNSQPRVYVGQTGYSSEHGACKQAGVFEQLFRSLYDQYSNYEFKIPVCVFEAYDHKNKDVDKRKMGLFEQAADGTYKVKEGINIPAWVNEPI